MSLLALLDRLNLRHRTTVHGLCRATFSPWANENAIARPEVVEAALAHIIADPQHRAYNRAVYLAERSMLLDRWSEYLRGDVTNV